MYVNINDDGFGNECGCTVTDHLFENHVRVLPGTLERDNAFR